MKKAISVFLTIVIAVTMTPFAFAIEANDVTGETVQFTSVGHGAFKLGKSSSFFSNRISDSVNANTGDTIVAYPTEDEEIFETSDGRYLTQAYDDLYLLTNKIDIDVDNLGQYRAVFGINDISDELYVGIEDTIAEQKELGNEDFSVEIYIPSLVNNSEISSASRSGETTVSAEYIYSSPGLGKYRMKDYTVKYKNCNHQPVYWTGSIAKPSSESFITILISIAGIGYKSMSIFGIGISLYDLYKGVYGEVEGSTKDSVNVSVVYDRLEKETKLYLTSAQGFVTGKISHKVWLNYLSSLQFYQDKGQHLYNETIINSSYYSRYWDDNEQTIARIKKEPFISVMLYTTKVILNGGA